MSPDDRALTRFVHANPHIIAAWYDDPILPTKIIAVDDGSPTPPITIPAHELRSLAIEHRNGSPIRILRTPATHYDPRNTNQACQNEPISAGTQIQPHGANWLGTAGAPVSWIDSQNARHWGILSNWHVLADQDERIGRAIHQPDTARPEFARLSAWSAPLPTRINRIDAAIADARIDGFHTIANRILSLGILGTTPLTATVGLAVSKSGRTTALTHGYCIGVGASVQVSYGDFTVTFEDQDVYAGDNNDFSAPGDSGSLIVGRSCLCPTSLLFAGSDELTVGNPIRHVTTAMNLLWPFN